jgi:hypothetical protein
MTLPGTAKIEWREPAALWSAVALLVGLFWPGLVITLILFPPSHLASDWRTTATLAAAIGIGVALWLIAQERRAEGFPRTRQGVLARFILFGAVFSVVAQVVVAVLIALVNAFSERDVVSGIEGMKTDLFMFGVVTLPFSLAVGVSHAVWAGLVAALVAFTPRPPSLRPHAAWSDAETAARPKAANRTAAPPAAPSPEPASAAAPQREPLTWLPEVTPEPEAAPVAPSPVEAPLTEAPLTQAPEPPLVEAELEPEPPAPEPVPRPAPDEPVPVLEERVEPEPDPEPEAAPPPAADAAPEPEPETVEPDVAEPQTAERSES